MEDRVKDLERINAQMSQEFTKFYDIVLAEGLLDASPKVSERLRGITEKIMRLGSSDNTGYLSPEDERVSNGKQSPEKTTSSVSGDSNGAASLGQTTLVNRAGETHMSSISEVASIPGAGQFPLQSTTYEVVAQATPMNASFPFFFNNQPSTNYVHFLSNSTLPATSQPTTPFQAVAMSPPPPKFIQATFTRRLRRRTQERSLTLASMANPPAERFAAVFGFCLLFESRDDIIRRLSKNLQEDIEIDVSQWKCDANGDAVPLTLEQADHMQMQIRNIFSNYRQEFLNSAQVEEYMKQLGIYVAPDQNVVEADIDLNVLKDVQQIGHDMSSMAPPPFFDPSGLGATNGSNQQQQHPQHIMQMSMHGMMAGAEHQILQAPNGSSYMYMDGINRMWGDQQSWPKTRISLNVKVLIEEMVSGSVCLGKSPGIRINDIHRAIRIASGLSH